MIEEDPTLAGLQSSAEQDTRTIAELAASVARSLADASSEPPLSATGAPQEEPDPADGDAVAASPPEEPHDRGRVSRKSRAAAKVVALLLLVIGLAYCQSGLGSTGSGNGGGDAGGAAAAPPVDGGARAPSDNPDAAIAAPPTEAPARAEPAPPSAVEIVEPPAPPPPPQWPLQSPPTCTSTS